MQDFARLAVVLGSIAGLSGALAVVAVGCGGDDTSVPLDSSTDITTIDSPHAETGGEEASAEGGGGDGSSEASDAGKDVALDVQAPPLDKFLSSVVFAFCDRLGECCGINPSAWDRNRCFASNYGGGSFVKNLPFHDPALQDGGQGVQYDTAKAAQCLRQFLTMSCTIATAEYDTIRNTCYGALTGTVGLNSGPCTDSIQCASPGRCDPTVDGGTCVALLGDGGLCTTSDDCSYRGVYQPALFCDDNIARHPDPADDAGSIPTCSPQLPAAGDCDDTDFEGACTSGICAVTGTGDTCQNSAVWNTTGTCDFFTIKDAGGGG